MKVKKAVIAAAGLGTRMLPAAKSVPKEMLPILDKPAIHYIIEEAVASGIEDILIITNRSKSAIEDYLDYSPELENSLSKSNRVSDYDMVRKIAEMANIYYIRQKETKGFGHAVLRAKSFAGGEPFVVLTGDDIMIAEKPVTRQLIEAAEKYEASAIGIQKVPLDQISKYSSTKISELEDRIYKVLDMNEKPSPEEAFSEYAILGRYVLSSKVFDILENLPPGYAGEIQLTDALRELCKMQGQDMVAVDFEGRRYDTGNVTGFLEATIDFGLADPRVAPWLKEFLAAKVKEF